MPRSTLYTALGSNVVLADPPKADQLTLLKEVWKVATKIADPKVGRKGERGGGNGQASSGGCHVYQCVYVAAKGAPLELILQSNGHVHQ